MPIEFNKKGKGSPSSMCGEIVFKNTGKNTAKSFALSVLTSGGRIASYHNAANEADSIIKAVLVQNSDERALLLGNSLSISSDSKYKIQSCFYSTDTDGITENDVVLGIDLSDSSNFGCTGTNCVLSCGNLQCSSGEDSKTCPIDCPAGENKENKMVKRMKKKKGLVDGESVWPGAYEIQVVSQKTEEICAKVFIGHNQNKVALSYIFTMQVSLDKAKVLSLFVNDVEARIIDNGVSSVMTYRQVGNGVNIEKNLYIAGASVCLEPRNGFDISKDIRIGIDMKDQETQCNPKNCAVQCGNGVCDSRENQQSCPIDCDALKR